MSLSNVLQNNYNATDLDELDDDQILELVTSIENVSNNLNSHPIYEIIVDAKGKKKRGPFDRYATIENILENNSVTDYMGSQFWGTRQETVARQRRLLERAEGHEDGEETLRMMADAKLGFYKLRPGDEVTVDVTKRWIEEHLKQSPAYKTGRIEIEGEEDRSPVARTGGRTVKRVVPAPVVQAPEEDSDNGEELEDLDETFEGEASAEGQVEVQVIDAHKLKNYNTKSLQALATKNKIDFKDLSRQELIKRLSKVV